MYIDFEKLSFFEYRPETQTIELLIDRVQIILKSPEYTELELEVMAGAIQSKLRYSNFI